MVFGAHAQQTEPTVAKDAKILYFTKLYPFHDGLAVVNTQGSAAIIDGTGKIVIPFGKFEYTNNDGPYPRYFNGMIRIKKDQDYYGFVNTKGVLVFPIEHRKGVNFQNEGFATVWKYKSEWNWTTYVLKKDGTKTMINNYDAQGKKLFEWDDPFKWHLGMSRIVDKDKYLFGYINYMGKIIKPVFEEITDFSEGLAAVSKKDEMGNKKWGFINMNGETVIPFQFSNQPYPFSSGLSLIKPLNMPDYIYGYIDKLGNIVMKIMKENDPYEMSWSPSNDANVGIFFGQYAFWKMKDPNLLALMDKTGKIKILNDVVKRNGVTIVSWENRINDNMIRVFGYSGAKAIFKVGLIDINGSVIIPPIFNLLNDFDPVSKLAYAEATINNNEVKGYVDSKGIFRMILGKATGL
ncbi:hypothetical protein AQF98_03340 [Pedobacter sp. Hv1]|nr:hypothetical protein AQF98_03340 [Pedobacter sp. Hv1]